MSIPAIAAEQISSGKSNASEGRNEKPAYIENRALVFFGGID